MLPRECGINVFPSCCHSHENNDLTIWHVSRHFLATAPCRSLNLVILMSNIMTAKTTKSTAAVQMCYDCLPCREITFSRVPKSAFKERDSCYINRALYMTFSMVNTLRIRFNSRTVSFFKKRLHLSAKERRILVETRRGRVVCFSQNKGETKKSKLMMSIKGLLNCFLILPFLKPPTSS